MSNDDELLRRYAETRSEPAFAALVERHLGLVYAAALRRLDGDTHRATEITQTVFIALARHAADLAQRPVLASWLHTATRHAVIDLLRAERRRQTREQHAHNLATVNASPSASADAGWDQLRPLIDAALDQLNEHDRALLLLRFFEQHPFADIAAKLHLTEDAARMRTTRALEKLRTHLSRHGITSTATALGAALTTQPLTAAPVSLATTITTGAIAGSTTLTASSLLLMTTATKTLVATVALITTLAIGTAVYESRRAEQAIHFLADLQRERDTLSHQTSDLNSRLAASSAEISRLTSLQKETVAKLTAASAPKPANVNSVDVSWLNPAFGPAWAAQQSAALGMRYGQLYRELQLTPEQIGQFEKIQTELKQAQADVWTLAANQGLPTNGPDVARLTMEPYAQARKNLEALLGGTGITKLDKYEAGNATRELVASLAGNVYYSDTPLTANQGTALTTIITNNTETKKTAMKDEGANTIYTVRKETNWDLVTAQAAGLLSPSQLIALKQLAEQKRLNTELQKILSPPPK
ncbi:MAG: sigma-70 family RNA polymerase sigma factor [Undibacterium sp.]|nr:sigma-70 family RNA polymerase sigma factor [Opitutaceae bacterium]